MAITYPLNTPTNIGIANITLMAENAVAVSQSPFTFSQQIVAHPGQRWAASISLPPMKRQDAENWIAFLLSLKGQVGTFLLGDPNGVNDQGVAAARRNTVTYSEQVDNVAWTKVNSAVTANAITAPNGLAIADLVYETAVTGAHQVRFPTTSFVAGETYTFSVHIKDHTGRNLMIQLPTAAFGVNSAIFSPSLGTVVSSTAGLTTSIESVGGGWYRASVTKLCSTSNSNFASINIANGTTTSYLGDGASGVYVWGLQQEVGTLSTYQGIIDTFGPLVNGASQTGNVLNIDGCSPNVTGWFLPGDYIQLGSGSATQLYKVLTSVDTNASGQASIDLWPNLRSSPADNSAVVFTNAKGKFRLKDNVTQWGINEISSYGITFDCVEAL